MARDPLEPDDGIDPLGPDELRRRTTSGAALLGARAALVLGLGVVVNIALARMLDAHAFGVVALGMSFILLGAHLADGGLGAALIRRPEEPSRRALEAVNGAQIALTLGVTLVVAAVCLPFGRDGQVVATMVATLPITVLRTPSIIVLERRLRYREIATADVVESLVFYAWALIAVALGAGLWGIATAAVARALVGTALLLWLGPLGLVRPRWAWSDVRPFAGFGIRMQAAGAIALIRNQVLNTAVALVAGVATLGAWNLAFRVLQLPHALSANIARVAYPALARVLAAGRDVRPVLERALGAVALAVALLVVAIAGFAPALPALVGPGWEDVPATLLWSSVAMLLGTPIWTVISQYLFAANDPGTVLAGATLQSVVWLATVPLVASAGAPMIGIGWIAASVISGVFLWRRAIAATGAAVGRSLAAPTVAALAGIAVGWMVADAGGASVLRGVLGAGAGELVLVAGLAVWRRALLRDAVDLAREALRGSPTLRSTAAAG